MALIYLETSALVKLYVYENGTERLLALTAAESGHRFAIFSLAQVEFRAAIRRRQRNKELSQKEADGLLESFREHSEAVFLIQPFSDLVLDLALMLVDTHKLKAYDAMQLAGFLALRFGSGVDEPIFACADQALMMAARNEGCAVLDPAAS